jgi:hypothetical protein
LRFLAAGRIDHEHANRSFANGEKSERVPAGASEADGGKIPQ